MSTLFMVKIGATPKGRLIEQHDMFFGVANHINELIPAIDNHWQEVKGLWHFDAYRSVTKVGDHQVAWLEHPPTEPNDLKLWFINLGGYLPNEFEEFHHKLLIVAPTRALAIKQAKQTDFYQTYGYTDNTSKAVPTSHIDDKMQVSVDDVYDINGLLNQGYLHITPILEPMTVAEDQQVIGYIKVNRQG